jgi:hypothetical protein
MRHARQALFLALVAVLVTVTGAKALDADSPEYALRDAAGNNFRLIARVRHIPYSDHILVQSFGLRVNVMTVGHRAVCEDDRWTRSAPAPYNGRFWDNGAPFPLYYWNTPQWTYEAFGQRMYWGGPNTPVWIEHMTSGEDICGSLAGLLRAAGIKSYRFPTYWYWQAMTR